MRGETEAAIRAVRIVGHLTEERTGADRITSKGGIDLVTDTDLAAEQAIRTELLSAFPKYPVVGEEYGGTPRDGTPYWLVDPICGTRVFAWDIPLYCTNIALVEDGTVAAAAVGVGRTGEILYAEKGSGAWVRGREGDRRVHAGTGSHMIWVGGETTDFGARLVDRLQATDQWYVLMFPSTIGSAYLATGRIAGLVYHAASPSPSFGSVHATAGCFLAMEAGAVVTDLVTGTPWKLDTRSVLMAGTPRLHVELENLLS